MLRLGCKEGGGSQSGQNCHVREDAGHCSAFPMYKLVKKHGS